MKLINYLIIVAAVIALGSCGKVTQTATVIKDCTGSYIRINGKDFYVCNSLVLNNHEHNTEVKVSYELTEDCNAQEHAVCLMYHPYEGTVVIKSIQ